MNKVKVQHISSWVWVTLLLIIGGIGVFYINLNRKESDLENRQLKLENVHSRAINEFSNSIEKFAALVSGMQSYVSLSNDMPTALEFQNFINHQLNYINYQDSIVVSYVDTSLIFRYSFTRQTMDPAGLVGKSVVSLRDKKEIDRLRNLMQQDSIRMFYPINLIEGWVGIPINFRVIRDDKLLGFVAPIINFKSIIQPVYDEETSRDFVFRFQTEKGTDLDRERLYDGSRVYNTQTDPEYYRNFDVDPDDFIYSTVNFYGLSFTIGTAYKEPFRSDTNFTLILIAWYLTFAIFVVVLNIYFKRYKKLLNRSENINTLLEKRRKEVSTKNEQLSRLNETKNKFFSIIGHDIRGPLNSIEGLLTILKFENVKDPHLNQVIGNLERSVKNTVNLLNNLLRWARMQTGDIDFRPEALDIKAVIRQEIDTLKQQAAAKQITIEDQLEGEYAVTADVNMLQTVFRNLISNAIKFTPIGGAVRLSAEAEGNFLKIHVSDNGQGMPPEKVATLFSLDKHLSTPGTEGESGTGLGLLLCQEFVRKHGGRLRVSSKPEEGSTFTVALPLQGN